MAHPPLAEHQHAQCAQAMKALKQCHDQYKYLKFIGKCNHQKQQLNLCLRGERLDRARENLQQAKQKRIQVEQKWQQIKEES
ncbi:hypothetical protein OIO90_004981 [Microbotryomycetes sp. JL221]|nr:hypothetical protein OIO90_004981 [Microbotryomycetes sp. JL221]